MTNPLVGTATVKPPTQYTPMQIYKTMVSALAMTSGKKPSPYIMTLISLAESSGKVNATNSNSNGSTDYGLWQINSIHGYDSQRLISDPLYNATAAIAIWQGQGYNAWTVYKSGAFKSDAILSQAQSAGLSVTGIGTPTKEESLGEYGLGKAGDALGGALGWTHYLTTALSLLTQKSFWVRAGLVLLGGGALIVGIVLLAGKSAMSITPVGKIASVVGGK